jgi:hypothetical protein
MIGFFARHCHSPSCGQPDLVQPAMLRSSLN